MYSLQRLPTMMLISSHNQSYKQLPLQYIEHAEPGLQAHASSHIASAKDFTLDMQGFLL